jgi:hypothetical protein
MNNSNERGATIWHFCQVRGCDVKVREFNYKSHTPYCPEHTAMLEEAEEEVAEAAR